MRPFYVKMWKYAKARVQARKLSMIFMAREGAYECPLEKSDLCSREYEHREARMRSLKRRDMQWGVQG